MTKAAPKTAKRKTPVPSQEEAAKRYLQLDQVVREWGGYIDELEAALGMYVIGHHFGWKVLYLVHSKKTIRKYEGILGIKIAETFPEFGPDADRTNAFKIINTVSNFWKAVSGEEKVPGVDKRALVDSKGT